MDFSILGLDRIWIWPIAFLTGFIKIATFYLLKYNFFHFLDELMKKQTTFPHQKMNILLRTGDIKQHFLKNTTIVIGISEEYNNMRDFIISLNFNFMKRLCV